MAGISGRLPRIATDGESGMALGAFRHLAADVPSCARALDSGPKAACTIRPICPRACHYSGLWVALHWLIAVLVIVLAFVTNWEMGRMAEVMEKGIAPSLASRIGADLHVAFGVTVFLVATVRVGACLYRGASPLPDDEPLAMRLVPHLISPAVPTAVRTMRPGA